MPNTYVSYQTAESADPTFTEVFPNSDNPVWDHQNETRLSTELLYQENRVSINCKSDRNTGGTGSISVFYCIVVIILLLFGIRVLNMTGKTILKIT